MRTKLFIYILIGALFLNIGLWSHLHATSPANGNLLKVVFLDIGQGDAIYIEAPNGHQMIIDGGPKSAVMSKLAQVMPIGDTSIDTIVVTNPDADHYSGFIDVLKKYDVGTIVEPGTVANTKTYKELEKEIAAEGSPHLIAHKGMQIVLDQEHHVVFDVLFPDRDVSGWSRNDGSIVGKLSYGKTSFMLMGDATTTTERAISLRTDKNILQSDVLKLGHHGSRTSSGESWLETVKPKIVIISAGKNNSYGHPNQEVIDRLQGLGIQSEITFNDGNITFLSDGDKLTIQKER